MTSGKQSRRERVNYQCPDCGARTVRGRLTHLDTCPAARALEVLMVADAKWFVDHPGAVHRCRWITAAERMELGAMTDSSLPDRSAVHVQQLEPGVRRRALYLPGDETIPAGTIGLWGHPETFARVEGVMAAELPQTHTGTLPDGLQVRLFQAPATMDAGAGYAEFDGLLVLSSADRLPVPYSEPGTGA